MTKKTNISIFMVILFTITILSSCTSRVVPPGTVVLVLKADGSFDLYTSGSFIAYGRDRVYFIDTKLKSFTESMNILCKDNINMKVDVKWIGSFAVTPDKIKIIKEKVLAIKGKYGDIEGYILSLSQFYNTAMKDIIRVNTREAIAPYITDNIRDARAEISKLVKSRVLKRFKELGYPIETTDIMISNLDYPDEITAQRKAIKAAQLEDEKQAALSKAAIAAARRADAIAKEEAKATLTRAETDAKANMIRAKSLTPEIIQMRQWDVLEKIMNESRKGDVIVIPYQALGGPMQDSIMFNKINR